MLLLSCLGADAQYSFNANVSGLISVSTVQSLSLTGGAAIPNFSSMNDYYNGVVMDDYLTVGVKSNVPWMINVQAQSQYFTPMTTGGSTNMPASVLSLKTSLSGNYTALSPNGITLKTGNRGGAAATGNNFTVDMRFNPGFAYKGGIYTIGLLYTLTAQ